MLHLSFKLGERVIFNKGNIIIEIIRLSPNQVCLGFTAPHTIAILREIVFKKDYPECILPPARHQQGDPT